ncbi:MAG TPA: ATP-binding protein [Umezawaea sp.]|nr:ATP-binding protein [Umezawaea sp.]
MDVSNLGSLIDRLRRIGGEPSEVEAKSAAGGLPKNIAETLSAFANTNGGIVVLGVDESNGFALVDLSNPAQLRDNLASLACDALQPPLRIATEIVEVDGHALVVAEVDPVPSDLKPCFIEAKGIATGSYVRVGDGDRRMTQAEVGLAIANRGQPRYDLEPMPEATVADLDRTALLRTIERVRATSRAFRDIDEQKCLERLCVLVRNDQGVLVPSLGGLLTFGVYPQQFFPQLTISLVVHGSDLPAENAPRFEDNPVIRGPIPDQVAETVAVLRRHMRVRSYVNSSGRLERLDYPLEAVREAVVNALLHRDYSPVTRGTQVQVDLYPDRLSVRSPGGLFGPVVLEELGSEGVSSSRNSFLASLLSDTYLPGSDRLVAENRASGVPSMIRELRRSGMTRPTFRNVPARFEVEFSRSELLDSETRRWLGELNEPGLTQVHELALATMYHGQPISNAALREFGATNSEATAILRDLVTRGLAVRTGGRRYASYSLGASTAMPDLFTIDQESSSGRDVRAVLEARGSAKASELTEATGYSRPTVLSQIEDLIREGLVTAEGKPRSPQRRYRWTGRRS